MGNQTSKTNSKERKTPKASNPESQGMFNKELKHAFRLHHSYQDPYIPLFLIQAHSTDTETTFELPKGIHLFHYCKKGCILRTKRINHNAEQVTFPKKDELHTDYRSVSMEYACLKQLEVYDTYEKSCPRYQFFIHEANRQEAGIYVCLDKEIQKVFTFEPGQTYSLTEIIPFIQDYVPDTKKIHIGMLSCRTTNACSDVIVALPGSPSTHENKLNPNRIHKPYRRTLNQKGENRRKGLPPALAMYSRKGKRKNRSP